MDSDQHEPNSSAAIEEESRDPPRPKQLARFRYSLRTLLLMFVPVAILAFMFRWLHDHGHIRKLWYAGFAGAFWGVFLLAIGRGLSLLVRDSKEPNEPILQDFRTIVLAALVGGVGVASLLSLLLWAAETFA